jgi:hypothetical protein
MTMYTTPDWPLTINTFPTWLQNTTKMINDISYHVGTQKNLPREVGLESQLDVWDYYLSAYYKKNYNWSMHLLYKLKVHKSYLY